ncbi:hypothetical protein [Pelomonas sp. Root1217]|nr:hypothetical protein [Pelomonas sp. Root1217]
MNTLPLPTMPQPLPRPAVSFARMLVLAQRRFRDQQQRPAAAA